MRSKDLNSGMESDRYEANRTGVSERTQEQSCVTLYRKMLISWSFGFGIVSFLYLIKAMEETFI